jgi:hypothetical protein
MLGVTVETLGELRDRREVHGYRDGASWKFKEEDIERLKDERASAAEEGEFAEMDEDPDSILLSEVELGKSGDTTSSTIIGGRSSKDPLEDDIQIARPKHDSDVLDDVLGAGSDAGGSGVLEAGGSGVSPMFDDLDNLDLEMASAADSGISTKQPELGGSSPVLSAGDDDFTLGSDSAIGVEDSGLKVGSNAGTSDIMLSGESLEMQGSGLSFGDDQELALGEDQGLELESAKSGGSDIDLTGDLEDDLVLGGSSHGSDISRTGDSGISLLDPADSGISLEAPQLELGGSSVEQLELGEEDDMLVAGGSEASAGEDVAPSDSDDDFLLTPLEEGAADESDSGSQVIALESEVEFDDEAGGGGGGVAMFEEEPAAGGGLLEDDLGEGFGAAAAFESAEGAGAGMAAAGAPAMAGAGAMVPDVPFTGWNVMSLVLCAVMLLFCGMFAFDLMRNMWSWDAPYSVNSSMMEMILSWFE